MNEVLLDTDIIMDFYLRREPFAIDTAKVMSLCEAGIINGYVTPVIYSNLYYLLRKLSSHENVIAQLRQLFFITQVLVIDKHVVLASLNSNTITDFEDALQNYAVEKSGKIKMIITRNVKDFRKSDIAALTPFDFLKLRFKQI